MSCSKLTMLSLVDAYSQIHQHAQTNQKACSWQLTKARQNQGRRGALVDGVFLADDVREELRATQVLKDGNNSHDDVEPSPLLDEDATSTASKKKAPSSLDDEQPVLRHYFVLTDVNEELSKKDDQEEHEVHPNKNEDKASGIRRRKGREHDETAADTTTKEWTVVEGVDPEKEEEKRLRAADPLDLFGAMPPQELRTAQAEAQKALAFYVEAANLVAAIQQSLL